MDSPSASARAVRPAGPLAAAVRSATGPAVTDSLGTTRRLAAVNISVNGGGGPSFVSVSNVLVMNTAVFGAAIGDLGDGIYHTAAGTTNFTGTADPDLPAVATALTDGISDFMELDTWMSSGGGFGTGAAESYWLGRNPDLLGSQVDFVRLVIHDLHLVSGSGVTTVFENYTWEMWGHPLYVAFAPPTDANGTYLVERRYSEVNVSLASPGTAVLEWDGVNRTMTGSGTQWQLNLSGLANGVHTYRVWGTTSLGAVYASEVRTLIVQVGIWSVLPVGYGFMGDLAMDANGVARVCFYGGNLGGATGLVYGVRVSGGWNLTVVESTSASAGQGCSIALDTAGLPHISYIEGPFYNGSYAIRYAAFDGTAWTTQAVAYGSYSPTSIAMNPATGRFMIAYGVFPSVGLVLATQGTAGWTTQVVDPSYSGDGLSLAVDSTGHPRIAYASFGPLNYANWTGTKWTFTKTDIAVYAVSLQLDSGGGPHVAYVGPSGLKYASGSPTIWTNTTVDRTGTAAVSLALDRSNRPHIAYQAALTGELRVATFNATWEIQVASDHASGYPIGIGLRPQGDAGIVFDASTANGALAYATNQADTAPPTTVARLSGSLGARGWYTSAVSVTLVATDDLAVHNTTYSLDGGPWTPYASPFLVTSDGNHTLRYFSTDDAFQTEVVKTTALGIDTAAPVVTATPAGTVGLNGWYLSNVTVTLTATDRVSGVASIQDRVDGGAWSNYTAPLHFAGDGTYLVRYTATDAAGNTAAIGSLPLAIDTGPPSSTLSVRGTSGLGGWFVSSATLTLAATDAVSGVASILVQVDAGAWRNYTGPFALGDGAHTVLYRAVDRAGNLGAVRTAVVDVDTTPPVITGLGPSGTLTTSSVTFSWSGSDSASGIARYELAVDGGPYQNLGTNTSATVTLADGAHVLSIRAFDVAGNSVSKTLSVQVDTNPLSLTGPFHGIPVFAGIAAAVVVTVLVLRSLLRRKGPPQPPPAP